MHELFEGAVVVSILAGMVRVMTPILFAAMGELVTQRAGIWNMGVEGTMLMGAFTAYFAATATGSLWLAVLAAMAAGAAMGLLIAVLTATLRVDHFISGLAECNRHPFDVVEGESEIVAGHMVEYSGMSYAMFMLAEYANMILVATLASIMFLGGWHAPFAFLEFGGAFGGFFWLFLKMFMLVSTMIWVRGTFPRYRYDQIMRLGWKVFIPITLVWLVLVAGVMQTSWNIWK